MTNNILITQGNINYVPSIGFYIIFERRYEKIDLHPKKQPLGTSF